MQTESKAKKEARLREILLETISNLAAVRDLMEMKPNGQCQLDHESTILFAGATIERIGRELEYEAVDLGLMQKDSSYFRE